MARYSSRGRPRHSLDSYYDSHEDVTRSTYNDRSSSGGIFDALFHCTDFGRDRYEEDYYDYARERYEPPPRRRYYYDDDEYRGRGYPRTKARDYDSESSYTSHSSANDAKNKKRDKKKAKDEKRSTEKKKSSSSKKDKEKKKERKEKKKRSTSKSRDEKDQRNDKLGSRKEDKSELREKAPPSQGIIDPNTNGHYGFHQISQKMAAMFVPNSDQLQSSSIQSKTQSTLPTNTTSTGPSQRSYEPSHSSNPGAQYAIPQAHTNGYFNPMDQTQNVSPQAHMNDRNTYIDQTQNAPPTPMSHHSPINHNNRLLPHSPMMRSQSEIPPPHEMREHQNPYPPPSPQKHQNFQSVPQQIPLHHNQHQQHPHNLQPPMNVQYQPNKPPTAPAQPEAKQTKQPPKIQKPNAPQIPTVIRSDFDLSDTVSAITMIKPISMMKPISTTRGDIMNNARVSSSKMMEPDGAGASTYNSLSSRQRSNSVSLREKFRQDGTLEAIIPPGDMSIVLSSSNNGLIVERISERSVARDLLQVGDTIVALDGVDITMFSAKVAAQLLHKRKHNKERIILYVPGSNRHHQEQYGMGQGMSPARVGRGDYYDSQVNGRIDEGHHQYKYAY